jgi:hypothetical protein
LASELCTSAYSVHVPACGCVYVSVDLCDLVLFPCACKQVSLSPVKSLQCCHTYPLFELAPWGLSRSPCRKSIKAAWRRRPLDLARSKLMTHVVSSLTHYTKSTVTQPPHNSQTHPLIMMTLLLLLLPTRKNSENCSYISPLSGMWPHWLFPARLIALYAGHATPKRGGEIQRAKRASPRGRFPRATGGRRRVFTRAITKSRRADRRELPSSRRSKSKARRASKHFQS